MPAPRRVLMTADAVGGVWRYALDLAAALRARGTSTVLAVLGPEPSAAMRREAEGCCEAVAGFPCRLEWMDDPWEDVRAAGEWLQALASQWPSDVIHLNGYRHAALDWDQPVIAVAHSDVSSWWRAVHECAPPPDRDGYPRASPAGAGRRRRGRRAVARDGRGADAGIRPRRHPRHPERLRDGRWPTAWPREGPDHLRRRPALGRGQEHRHAVRDRARTGMACVRRRGCLGPGPAARRSRMSRILAGSMRPTCSTGWRVPRSTPCRRATSRSACRSSRPRRPAARWCSATFPACARTGTTPRCSCRPTIGDALAATLDRLIADTSLRVRLGAAAARALRALHHRAMAQAYEEVYRDVLTARDRGPIVSRAAEVRR